MNETVKTSKMAGPASAAETAREPRVRPNKVLGQAFRLSAMAGLSATAIFSQQAAFSYNTEYSCNKERIVVGHCRNDPGQPGFTPVPENQNFCMVYYPDRPKRGGFTVQQVELRADVVKKLTECGALGAGPSAGGSSGSDVDNSVVEFHRGEALYKENNFADALAHFLRSNEYAPSSAAYYMIGLTQFKLKNYRASVDAFRQVVNMAPANPEAHYELAAGLFVQQKFSEALAEFQEAVRLKPDYKDAIRLIGSTYVNLGQKDNAMQAYRSLKVLDPQAAQRLLDEINAPPASAPASAASRPVQTPTDGAADPVAAGHFAKGKELFEAEDYEKAIPELEQAVASKIDRISLLSAYVYLGNAYNLTQQYARSLQLVPKALLLEKAPQFYSILGDAYEATMQLPKAIEAYKEAVRLDPDNPQFLASLGTNYALTRRATEARQVLAALLRVDKDSAKFLQEDIDDKQGPAGILVKRAQLALLVHENDEALLWFRNALKLNPTDPDLLTNIGNGLDIFEKYDEALAVYRRILTLKQSPKDMGTTHYFIGQTYNNKKEFAKALPELIEAIRLNPDYYAQHELGVTYTNLKRFPEALAAYQGAAKIRPDEIENVISIGRTYDAMGDPDKAVATFGEVARVDPKSTRGFVEIGNLDLRLKRFADAGRAFTAALKIEPKNASAIYGVGRAFVGIGRKPEATRAYNALKPLDAKLAGELLEEINRP